MHKLHYFIAAVLCGLPRNIIRGSAILKWPDPQLDFIDEVLYGGDSVLARLTDGCFTRDSTTVAAQWIRIAYHDMSTHNTSDESGGLDASIKFELDRPQNIGQGMSESITDFGLLFSPYVGFADVIAMGAVLAAASCGGPIVPFRGGRIDAKIAGPATVPEPHQDLQSHIDSFRRQGFTQTEMIALVACGHTLGGVRLNDFPQIVTVPNPIGSISPFDTGVLKFDNSIVIEYLAGTTANPLVKTANVTNRSDLRIFSSDKNITMQSIVSAANFNATCRSLFERMLNTIPRGVTLTDTVDPFENKVKDVSFFVSGGKYVLKATLRRLTPNTNRLVTLVWKERQTPGFGTSCPAAGCVANSTGTSTSPASFFGEQRGIQTFTNYQFVVPIPLNTSVSSFWFNVIETGGPNSGANGVVDNGGNGYAIEQDTVLFDPSRSALVGVGSESVLALVVAVRTSNISGTDTKLAFETYAPGSTISTPSTQTVNLQQDSKHVPADGYTFFTGNVSSIVTSLHVNAVVGGRIFQLYVESADFLA